MTLRILDNLGAPSTPRPEPRYRTTAVECSYAEGFYWEEDDGVTPFRWMQPRAVLTFDALGESGFLELEIASDFQDLSQELTVAAGEETVALSLLPGWVTLSVPVAAGVDRIELRASKLLPRSFYAPGDERDLAVRVARPRVHRDAERHRHVARQHANGVLNRRELLAGRTVLRSTPPSLGIDMYGVCNVKPPCVYCEWDFAKDLEGENVETPFNLDTLTEYGDFFDNSTSLVNCSIGEPFMMKELDDLLDAFGDRGKFFEVTTNGQILTERNIKKLLGRKIQLYISLDAATPETYAKLRNDTFERILSNLRRLIAAKGGREGLPRVFLVFMPMQCNVHELEGFVELCAELDVDRMILRPLNYSVSSELDWERDGYHFRYHEELLGFDELIRVSGRARALAEHYGVPLADQLDFGGSMETMFAAEFGEGREAVAPREAVAAGIAPAETAAAESTSPPEPIETASLGEEKLPACHEPWKSFYVLRRGTMPCCYGHAPIAEMGEFREAWNSPILQEIRRELAAGRFHRYCLDSVACPIVRKSGYRETAAEPVPPPPPSPYPALLRRLWHLANRASFDVPRRLRQRLRQPRQGH